MAHQEQKNLPPQHSNSSPTTAIVVACLAVTAAGYFGLVRPAQLHMESLERQCNKLVVAVKKLQSKDDTARHGLRLLNLLDAQSEKIAAAEGALKQFTELRERLSAEADALAQATSALEQLENVRSEVDAYSESLRTTVATLNEMAKITTKITASNYTARKANNSLASLGKLQTELAGGMVKLNKQLVAIEAQLSNNNANLPKAEQSLTQIDQLCEQLASESSTLTTARMQLNQLALLKQDVIDQAADIPAAEAVLDQVWDLQEGMKQAQNTIAKTKQLAVDMMLLEPVLDRVAKSLQPMAESTRLSRREAAKSPKTRQTAASREVTSPWSNAIEVFVALLGNKAE